MAGTVFGFPAHVERTAALGEVHARPHPTLEQPSGLIQLAFMTEPGSRSEATLLSELSRSVGAAAPGESERHHAMRLQTGTLRWERHTEFSTYLWIGSIARREPEGSPFGDAFHSPGPAISGIRLDLFDRTEETERLVAAFDPGSLCVSLVESGKATVATDFQQDADGMTRILVLDGGLGPERIGALCQRVLDLETYRTLAMLGLPLAQSLSIRTRRMEDRLAALTAEMRTAERRDSQTLLAELTDLAAQLEADAAASLYRFGASRAYDGIVQERLAELNEAPVAGFDTLQAFLQRRLAPAMRTCRSVEERQANLSQKLARTANLLRTWVDVEVERQNRHLLASMNDNARAQLRLQQTVEGLSVAAVSYYVVGLVGYVAKGGGFLGHAIAPELVTAISVPVAVVAVWWLVRKARRAHGSGEEP